MLDRQVEHTLTVIQARLGAWLRRCFQHSAQKREEAEDTLQQCGFSEAILRAEWKDQVNTQTKPLKCQSKDAGKKIILELIQLQETREGFKKQIEEYNSVLADPATPFEVYIETDEDCKKLRSKLAELTRAIAHTESALSIEDNASLTRLSKNQYVTICVNALGVKEHLRDKLRSCKFELEHVERALRKQVNDKKVNEHTEASVKRHDPSISQLASTYNKLCDKLVELFKAGKAPHHALLPQKIEAKGLFALDVDDTIWQDIGLGMDSGDHTPPVWLSNEKAREGIRALLEYDRCLEEDERLRYELRNLRSWCLEEWQVVNAALTNAEINGLQYCLTLRRKDLLRLCSIWSASTESLSVDLESLPSWGPTTEELLVGHVSQKTQVVSGDEDYDNDDDDESSEGDITDLADILDTFDLFDAFRAPDLDIYAFEDCNI
ncbi:hypothetical protein H0H92_008997 [Tricholoma furcatifolium]|nr:hypothetical protein H0H92_008997 [Tricholoma furcatifolium]